LVEYLASLEPAQGIRPLLEQIAKGRDVRLAIALAFGRPVPQLEEEWFEIMRRGAGPTLAPPVSEVIIGAAFVLAFAIAYVVIRRRSARIRRRMEDEERLRALMSGLSMTDASEPQARRDGDEGPFIE